MESSFLVATLEPLQRPLTPSSSTDVHCNLVFGGSIKCLHLPYCEYLRIQSINTLKKKKKRQPQVDLFWCTENMTHFYIHLKFKNVYIQCSEPVRVIEDSLVKKKTKKKNRGMRRFCWRGIKLSNVCHLNFFPPYIYLSAKYIKAHHQSRLKKKANNSSPWAFSQFTQL